MPDTLAATPDSAPGQGATSAHAADFAGPDFGSGVDEYGFLEGSPMSESFGESFRDQDTPTPPGDGSPARQDANAEGAEGTPAAPAGAQAAPAGAQAAQGEDGQAGDPQGGENVPWHRDKRWQEFQAQRAEYDQLREFRTQVEQHFAQQQQAEAQRQAEQAIADRQAQLQQAVDLGQISEEWRDHVLRTEQAAQQVQQYQQALTRQMHDAEMGKARAELSGFAPVDKSVGQLPNGAPLNLETVLRFFPPQDIPQVTQVLKSYVRDAVEQGVAKRLAEQSQAPAAPVASGQRTARPAGNYRPGSGFSGLWNKARG